MDKQYIQFVERAAITTLTEALGYYTVRRDKPFVWLQEICCWVLNKLGAHYQVSTIAYTQHYVDISNLVDGIYKQIRILDRDRNIQGRRVLIGSEDFVKLCSAPDAQYHLTTYASSLNFGGLTVTVIPWMKGILVLPE